MTVLNCAVAGALAWILGSGAAEAAERRYAVVIGANTGDRDDAPLRYAESDAQRVAEVLNRLGGVGAGYLVVLTGAQAEEVRSVLRDVSARMARDQAAGDRAMLFVYYSGHADSASLHLSGTELPLRELRAQVVESPADLRVLVLDACQAGGILRMKGGAPIPTFHIDLPDPGEAEGLAVITASAEGEEAQESDRLQGGVFTHHLLAGLAGAADSSGDRRVTLQEAYHYAYTRTLSTTSRAPVVQHPSFSFRLQGQAEVPLTFLDGGRRAGQLRLADAGSYVIFDAAETRMVAEIEVNANTLMALPAGTYRVRRRLPDRVYEGTITIRDGEQVSLATADMLPQPYGQTARRGATGDRYAAVGLQLSGGVQGRLQEGFDPGPAAAAGLRLELPWISVAARARYSLLGAKNEFLSIQQQSVSGELSALYMADLGRVSLGAGLTGGLGSTWQTFDTAGSAPDRRALTGWIGPAARIEVALLPRLSLGLEGSLESTWIPVDGADARDARSAPRGGLDVTLWLH